jgi:hypothetical protein
MPNPSESMLLSLLLMMTMMMMMMTTTMTTYNYLPKKVISVQPDIKEIS